MQIYDLLVTEKDEIIKSISNRVPDLTMFNSTEKWEGIVVLDTIHINTLYTTGVLLDLRTSEYDFTPSNSNIALLIAKKTFSLVIKSDSEYARLEKRSKYQFNIGLVKLEKFSTEYKFHVYDDIFGGREIIITSSDIWLFFLSSNNLPEIAASMDERIYRETIPNWSTFISQINGVALP